MVREGEIKTFVYDSVKTGFIYSYFNHGCDWTGGAFAYNLLVQESPIFQNFFEGKWLPPSATGIFAVWPSPLGMLSLVDPKVLRLICFRIWLLEEIMIRYLTNSAIENCRKNKQTNLVILLIPRFL